MIIEVFSGRHERVEAPCTVETTLEDGAYTLIDEAGYEYPAQVEKGILAFVIPYMRAHDRKRLRVTDNPPEVVLQLEDTGSEIRVKQGSFLVASYKYRGVRRPYIYPLNSSSGLSVTEDAPRDHPHHNSFWTAHGDVNGRDFWAAKAVIEHVKFEKLKVGPAYAEIVAVNHWLDGDALILERRSLRVWNVASREWLIDYEVELNPLVKEVVLGDTKEAGILSLRVASSMRVVNGGMIVNSWGGVNEQEVWGRRAAWCDYSGPLGDEVYGVSVFDHPSNPRFPTYWHARDYGLMAANVFGLSYFIGVKGGEMRLEKSVAFKYRVYVHKGWASEARVGEKYLDYVFPPEVKVVG